MNDPISDGRNRQFGIYGTLRLVAFLAIALAGITAKGRRMGMPEYPLLLYAGWLPLWIPIAFAGYCVGRRAISLTVIVAFAICELVGVLFEIP